MENQELYEVPNEEQKPVEKIKITFSRKLARPFTTKAGKEYLIENFSIPYKDYDIIKGYRADDSYFAFAESFLNNTISCQRLAQTLKLGNLGEQIVLKSKKAFEQLEYIDSILAPSNIYYNKRTQRSDLARFEFLSNKQGTVNKDSIYLADLIRGNISPDDPRLQ